MKLQRTRRRRRARAAATKLLRHRHRSFLFFFFFFFVVFLASVFLYDGKKERRNFRPRWMDELSFLLSRAYIESYGTLTKTHRSSHPNSHHFSSNGTSARSLTKQVFNFHCKYSSRYPLCELFIKKLSHPFFIHWEIVSIQKPNNRTELGNLRQLFFKRRVPSLFHPSSSGNDRQQCTKPNKNELGNLCFFGRLSCHFSSNRRQSAPKSNKNLGEPFFFLLKGLIIFHPMDVIWMKNHQ